MNKRVHYQLIVGMLILIGLPAYVGAQTPKIPFHTESYRWTSAMHNGQRGHSAEAAAAETHVVRVSGAPWVRLHFGESHLGAGSFITITSLQDGARQILDATSLQQWRNTSAYFNGDAVEIQLHVGPSALNVSLEVDAVMVGEPPTESQCGPTDDRVASSDPKAGRLANIGCTGWIISNGLQVTAGHCLSGNTNEILEFNVPLSLGNGTIQHPGPQDQYVMNSSSRVFSNGGIGNDWGVFQVFNNSTTGLSPIAAQGASFTLVQDLTPPNIRITGYGVDSGTQNQTQQTHVGPNAGSSGTTMRYQTDTEGGNSGSPVIDDATGNAVGVHTNGGCSTGGGGSNSGTSTFNTAFWNAANPGPPTPSITVTGPNGGENFGIGTDQPITWTSANITGNVKIELSRDGGGSYETLFADTANDGVQTWTVAGAATSLARVKVTSINSPAVSDVSNANFNITTVTPPPPPPPPPPCTAKTAVEGTSTEAETLALLYRFRDQVLAPSARGQQYTQLYYQTSNEMVRIMLANPGLLWQTRHILERFTPVIQTLVDGGEATIRQIDLLEVERFLIGYTSVSSPGLRQTIEQLKRDIRDPRVQAEFRIRVQP